MEMKWIHQVLEELHATSPQVIADTIIRKAIEEYGLRERDDMTVVAICIE